MTSPFLWGAGSTNNGLITSALTLMTTELKLCLQQRRCVERRRPIQQHLQGRCDRAGPLATSLPSRAARSRRAGANIGSSNREAADRPTTIRARSRPRAPDFIIPSGTRRLCRQSAAWSAGTAQGHRPRPGCFKVYVQNNAGVTLSSSGNTHVLSSPDDRTERRRCCFRRHQTSNSRPGERFSTRRIRLRASIVRARQVPFRIRRRLYQRSDRGGANKLGVQTYEPQAKDLLTAGTLGAS